MSAINSNALTGVPINNQIIPDEGPKAVPLLLDFSGSVIEYDLSLLLQQQSVFISMVQTIYIDLSGASHDLSVTVGTGVLSQVVKAKAGTQGYYQVLCPNPPQMKFVASALGDVVTVFLVNVPIPGSVWTS
jgi:hypothetical protein